MSELKKEQRDRHVRNLIKEAVLNVLLEQQPPVQTSAVPPQGVPPAPETNGVETIAQEPVAQEPEQFTVELMVDKLNILRGGQSFDDPEVFGRLSGMFNALTDEQRGSLEHMLNELAKAVIGATEDEAGVENQQQSAPQQQPPPPPAPVAQPGASPVSPTM